MDGRSLYDQAAKHRENGEFLEALKSTDEAVLAFQKEGDVIGLSEIQAERSLIFRHLHAQTDDRNFLIMAKFAAKLGVVIAEKSENPAASFLPLYNLARVYHLKGKHEKSIEYYNEALKSLPQSNHNSAAREADVKIHLGICEYINGDSGAQNRVLSAIEMLQNAEFSKYEKDVWVSGGYMMLAEAVFAENKDLAQEYLSKAKNIIESNPDLKLRQQQLQKMEQKLQ